jgi:hypothetical protein
MQASGSHRSGLLTAGGILSIVVGTFQVIGGVLVPLSVELRMWLWRPMQAGPDLLDKGIGRLALIPQPPSPVWLYTAIILTILGIIAMAGGVSATRRRSFGLALAGAICALPLMILSSYSVVGALAGVALFPSLAGMTCGLASVSLGILAVIFVALGKREFGAKVAQNAISSTEGSAVSLR